MRAHSAVVPQKKNQRIHNSVTVSAHMGGQTEWELGGAKGRVGGASYF